MKNFKTICLIVLTVCLSIQVNAQNDYTQRFLDLREKMNDPGNGYFSADGVPYHSVETLMAEAPDHGHETTSEAYSYWIWMEAMYGGISGDWTSLTDAWELMEKYAIPNSEQQPTTDDYDPSAPATFASEHELPDYYPSDLETSVPVGEDPISAELTSTYGTSEIYAMHWLFDCDNFYGYGNLGDGVSTPSYINTFQRGSQESVWETVPHPSWEDFSWGNNDGSGFLKLFVNETTPAAQWRYTNAPDADARVVQAMYWATQFAEEQGLDPEATLPLAEASKMGDYVRLSMFDKYFKPIGVQDKWGAGGTGYESAHYLMSWYFAWGGPLTENNWSWRIGSSHAHFGYQNPVAAYALSEVDELMPISATGSRDWGVSLERQLEFYTWLQSSEGAIAGGATNCYNGDYEAYPDGTATFYEMAYQENPVYLDPGSNSWIGMQAWSMERIAELYYISGNEMAKDLLENWVPWIQSEVLLTDDGDFQIPASLEWSGQPETWNPDSPVSNDDLHVTVSAYGTDLGIAACLAKALTYYAAATEKYETLDTDARDLAQEILDRMWTNYYDVDGLGVSVEETRSDYYRFFEQEVYVPSDFTGTMANGDVIESGVTFIDIRSKYRDDPAFADLEAAYNAGEDYSAKYHRYWAQADIALANAEYGRLFGEQETVVATGIEVTPETLSIIVGGTGELSVTFTPINTTNKNVTWSSDNSAIASVDADGVVTGVGVGSVAITATSEDGGFTDNCIVTVTETTFGSSNEYLSRFLTLREKMNDPANGYFSADGVPYHSVETLMAEAPDHGHETTSEAYSYWIWMEAMYGGISGDWSYLNSAWDLMEQYAIPTTAQQPTTADYDASNPATYAAEHELPDYYPSDLETSVPVGEDPISDELTSTYGTSEIYAMHWLFDCDNFYGYGNLGDGVSTPSYINTFQRGSQESVWETVPHPSWEDFSWGNNDGSGFLKLFINESTPAAQWRYTNAPDADARVVQAMYWATQFADEQGLDPASTLPLAEASKMGDYVRLSMFDKYFKPIGVQSKSGAGGTGYESAHYLMSWYFAWGGPLTENNWSWRIGSSHAHFGYQNPVAAYALSEVDELMPISATGARDWGTSLERQLEFYTWLQSSEGAIAGGATNCYNGDYEAYPTGTATFYEMAYQEHPVYLDPGSNSWIGMQAWSMERIAELYYISGNEMAKDLLEKWVPWIISEVQLTDDGDFQIPASLEWTGQPETWNPSSPASNDDLHVSVAAYGTDLGIGACLAKALTYYAAATQKYGTLDAEAKYVAQEILDRMWDNYYEEDGLGVAVEETRSDYYRFFEQEVYVPSDFTGTMANGDVIESGVTFIDIRSKYRDDPAFADLEAAYNAGEDYSAKYHRYWAQADIALANAEYGRLFGDSDDGETVLVAGIEVTPETLAMVIAETEALTAVISPYNATNKTISWTSSSSSVASVDTDGNVTAVALGTATITATTEDGNYTDNCVVTVTENPVYTLTVKVSGNGSVSPTGGTFDEGTVVSLTATAVDGYEFTGWSVDLSGTSNPASLTMDSDKSVTATFEEVYTGGCDNPIAATLPISQDGAGDYCWVVSGDVTTINSWNTSSLTINDVDYTNTWSNSMPAKLDGYYYVQYSAVYDWAHFEMNGTSTSASASNATSGLSDVESDAVNVFPNPFVDNFVISTEGLGNINSIQLINTSGQVVYNHTTATNEGDITVESTIPTGVYILKIETESQTFVKQLEKK